MPVAQVLLDFDGTITLQDTVDAILERFAEPAWREVEKEWTKEKIGSRECLARQTALIHATPEEIDALVDEIEIDPGLRSFVKGCEDLGVGVTVVSDGFQRNITRVLDRAKIQCASKASALVYLGNKRWRLDSPFAQKFCDQANSTCKCAIDAAYTTTILVGDGRSDFCVAEKVKFVLAKGALAKFCKAEGIPHAPIENLSDAVKLLHGWLVNPERAVPAHAKLEVEIQ
jgi:2-hydroxy-3-keto-5-methylthiopentenyl-1-phosphate phosphatase